MMTYYEFPIEKFPYYKEEHLSKNQLYYDLLIINKNKLYRFIDIIDVPKTFGEMGLKDKDEWFLAYLDTVIPSCNVEAEGVSSFFLHKNEEGECIEYIGKLDVELIVGEEKIVDFALKSSEDQLKEKE